MLWSIEGVKANLQWSKMGGQKRTQDDRIESSFFQVSYLKTLKWKSFYSVQPFVTPWTVEFSRPENWSGSLSLLQGIFPIKGSNPDLPHCRWILYQMSYKRSLRILEWAAYPFSSESSWPRNWTGVSCIAGEFFTNCAIREALITLKDIHFTG